MLRGARKARMPRAQCLPQGAQVTAPGGDATVTTTAAPQGTVLGAWPAKFGNANGGFVVEDGAYYSYLQVGPACYPRQLSFCCYIIMLPSWQRMVPGMCAGRRGCSRLLRCACARAPAVQLLAA